MYRSFIVFGMLLDDIYVIVGDGGCCNEHGHCEKVCVVKLTDNPRNIIRTASNDNSEESFGLHSDDDIG
jgi:hypothetical protein